jgi:hypothetical protein
MNVMPPTPSHRLLPFESQLLTAVGRVLPHENSVLLERQVTCINHVQRGLDWKNIEFSCKRWFAVRWPASVLFQSRERFRLATVDCTFGTTDARISVWAVDGHVLSLESSIGMSGLSISGPLSIRSTVAQGES